MPAGSASLPGTGAFTNNETYIGSYMPEFTGTTKHESLFRSLLVRGFASDGIVQERARCARPWRGDSSPLQTSPYVDPERGGFFTRLS